MKKVQNKSKLVYVINIFVVVLFYLLFFICDLNRKTN